jgi:flavin-dependent dehydrogenase
VLGPLAVDVTGDSVDGLLLAGDAAGFIDPMTGDGLSFALRGGELAAMAALRALEHGWVGVHAQLAAARRRAFAGKWRFNRALRSLVASPSGVLAAAAAARIVPGVLRAIITRAGDCDLASYATGLELGWGWNRFVLFHPDLIERVASRERARARGGLRDLPATCTRS